MSRIAIPRRRAPRTTTIGLGHAALGIALRDCGHGEHDPATVNPGRAVYDRDGQRLTFGQRYCRACRATLDKPSERP